MKKYKSLSLILAACLLLTACNSEAGNGAETTIAETTTFPSEISITTTVPIVTTEEITDTPEVTLSQDEIKEIAKDFPVKTFTAPDGNEHKVEEAVGAAVDKEKNISKLTFDMGYIGYAQPIYSDTDKDSKLYSFENNSFGSEASVNSETKVENQKYFQLKEGQTLKNGLTVKNAYLKLSSLEPDSKEKYEISETTVTLSGEITLSGVLYCRKKDPNAAADYDEVLFYPNAEYSDMIPCPYFGGDLTVFSLADSKRDFAFVTSAFPFKLGTIGNMGNINVDLKQYFSETDCIKAKVTVSDLVIRYLMNTPACFGVLKEAEITE